MILVKILGCRGATRARGFTLIELIIALALVALITLLLFSGLRLGSRAWDGVDAVSERDAELRSAHGFMDRALMQSRDLTLTIDGEVRQLFTGGPNSLEFVAPLSEHVGIPGLYILRLGLEGRDKNSRLVLTRWLLHPDVLAGNAEAPEWKPLDPATPGVSGGLAREQDLAAGAYGQTVLLEGVADFDLAYFGVIEAGALDAPGTGARPHASTRGPAGFGEDESDGQWYEEWTDQPHPPKLIQVRLTSQRQDWPDSVIALPRVDQPMGMPMTVDAPQEAPVPPEGAAPGESDR
jgi:general secretion pathway protein J